MTVVRMAGKEAGGSQGDVQEATVSPLTMNLQGVNFQRCEHALHQCQTEARLQLQLALHLLRLTAFSSTISRLLYLL